MAQLVEEVCYKTERREFDSREGHWDSSLTQPLPEISISVIS